MKAYHIVTNRQAFKQGKAYIEQRTTDQYFLNRQTAFNNCNHNLTTFKITYFNNNKNVTLEELHPIQEVVEIKINVN